MSLRACFPTVIARFASPSLRGVAEAISTSEAPQRLNKRSVSTAKRLNVSTGFTILELLVVLMIMSMVIGMSIPAFSSYIRGSRLRTAAREISSTVMSARTQAITLREERVVFFQSADREFGIASAIGGERREVQTLPPGVRFGNFPSDGIKITPMGRVDGIPTGGHVITIFSDGAQTTITVGALGHVTGVR